MREDIWSSLSRALARGGGEHERSLASRDLWALRDVSFQVKPGEALGIIGRNGAGKSTLLKVLSRITDPTEGRVELRGRVGSLLEVGTGFHPELTGRENIYLNGAILGMKRAEIRRKFDEIVSFADLERFIDTPVKHYSSGMYVRLAFSVAAHLEPEILLIDEVLAVGDLEFRRKCLSRLQQAGSGSHAIVFVSHDMGSIVNLCPVTIWLDAGRIRAQGPSREVVTNYVSSSTYLGSEISWPDPESAPGNDLVRLRGVRIVSNDQSTSDILIDKEVRIEIDYWNFRDGAELYANIHLRDSMNDFVLASASLPSASLTQDCLSGKPLKAGLYRSVCLLPANFLNAIRYSIDVGVIDSHFQWQVWEKSILSFLVHETGEMKREYMGNWVGVVRPRLGWETEKLE